MIWGRGPGADGPCPLPQTPSPNPIGFWWPRLSSLGKMEQNLGRALPAVKRSKADFGGGMALMKTFGKLVVLPILFGLALWVAPAVAGESGIVSCATPGCDYQENLKIGGGMRSPAVTGYCRSNKQFVRLKLKSHDDYRKTHYCPGSKEKMQPIYRGEDVAEIPCPKCGNSTLSYKMMLRFD
jgi:hypothetical protein